MRKRCRTRFELNYTNESKPTSFVWNRHQNRLERSICAGKLSCIQHAIGIETFNLISHDVTRTPNMRLKTLLITLNWFANETVYLGLSYYGPSLGNNQYLSFFLSSLVEIPSYLCCWFVMDKWGRRWPMCLLMICRFVDCEYDETKYDFWLLFPVEFSAWRPCSFPKRLS